MTPLIVTVFVASVVGSLHCAGMCGAFVVFAVGSPDEVRTSSTLLHAAYNGGRLVVYAVLGAMMGAVGGAIDFGGSMMGAQRFAAALAAGGVAVFGVMMLLRARGAHVRLMKPPRIFERALRAGHLRATKLSPTKRALAIGLLTPLLPCGWLYSFALIAGGTGSPGAGALTMVVFWMGTLPMMVAIGASSRAVMGRFGSALPTLMPLAVIVAALGMIVMRIAGPPMTHHAPVAHSTSALQDNETAAPEMTMDSSAHDSAASGDD